MRPGLLAFGSLLALAPAMGAVPKAKSAVFKDEQRVLWNHSDDVYDLSIFKGTMDNGKPGIGSLQVDWLDNNAKAHRKTLATNGDHVTLGPQWHYQLTFQRDPGGGGVHFKLCLKPLVDGMEKEYRSWDVTSYPLIPKKPAIELVVNPQGDWSNGKAMQVGLNNWPGKASDALLEIHALDPP